MEEVEFRDIRTSQYVVVKQIVRPLGPRLAHTSVWAGKVSEVNNKWLKIKHDRIESIVAQQGHEQFFTLDKKEYMKFVKDYADRDIEV